MGARLGGGIDGRAVCRPMLIQRELSVRLTGVWLGRGPF